MKNLFDYATKELSQDAFLRWFFESYDDERLTPIIAVFLRRFAKGEFLNLEPSDILSVTTWAQWKHIDISIEVRFKHNGEDITRFIYIEDKVGSSEHNQLLDYNKAIDILRPNYRIYYKTSLMEQDGGERKRVNDAGWSVYDIDDIAAFFRDYKNRKDVSDVFSDYVDHVLKTYDDFHKVSLDPPTKWNKTNWVTFYHDFFDKSRYAEQGCSKSYFVYQGRYVSLLFYSKLKDDDGMNGLSIEFQVRGTTIFAYYHPAFQFGSNSGEWCVDSNRFTAMDGYEDYKIGAQNELDLFRDYIRKHGEEYGFHANNKKRSFAKTEKIDIGDKSIQGVSDELRCRIDKLIRLTETYRRETNNSITFTHVSR